ncbi:hypothetical protein [Streptomyces lanatus]|uniref:Uncharacterized protein n=1 Tax=Streptomyces lanatus TaxID=66900 RepID=A0ABV1Y322_9ACTN|nr:hypothetical protein [Streptomyces lanatus]GHH14336.1 hypothetical protein GCM10018780_54830 [Streptomyces lanatus]
MRAPRALRTALVTAGVTTTLAVSAAGAFAAPSSADVTSTTRHTEAKRVYVKTVQLADKVSRAKVHKTGKDRYEAEIWADDVKYGTLYTQGMPTHAQHNGLHITLEPSGRVTSWVDGAKPGPEPVVERVLIGTSTLADGSTTAKIYRVTDDHYEADVFANGVHLDTLVADGRAAYGENNGLHIALHPDGKLTSWVDRP